jgi:hypothetical protein
VMPISSLPGSGADRTAQPLGSGGDYRDALGAPTGASPNPAPLYFAILAWLQPVR